MEIVIGSWGSYNACNERALGSQWLDLSDYDCWEEIEAELIDQGFELKGIDEELFIQDIEDNWGFSGDYMHPKRLFEIFKSAGLDTKHKEETALAFIGTRCWDDFVGLVEQYGDDWDRDIYYYPNRTPAEVAEEMVWSCYPELDFEKLGWIGNFVTIDYESMADEMPYYEVSGGTIEIRE